MDAWAGRAARGLRVARVRMRAGEGASVDALAARRRFEMAVDDISAAALGLPAHAILVVKRVAPSARLTMGRSSRGDAFEQEVHARLTHLARAAPRPWHSPVGAAVEAVLFADEAELVACLVRDCLGGAVGEHWWWHNMLGDAGAERWLRARVLGRGEVLAPALAMLATRGDAASWVAGLDAETAASAAAAVARTYALDTVDLIALGQSANTSSMAAPDLRHLVRTVPEVMAPSLGPAQRRLLAVALAIVRAPAWARTIGLPRALHAIEAPPVLVSHDGRALPPATDVPRAWEIPSDASPTRLQASTGAYESVAGITPKPPGRGAPSRERRDGSSRPRPPNTSGSPNAGPARDPRRAQPHARTDEPEASSDITTDLSETRPTPAAIAVTESPHWPTASIVRIAPPAHVHTAFGGGFYLLNAFLALGLYGDFTAPRMPGLALSPWDLLALTGREWFGRAFMRDPVWRILAELAGRESGEAPGHRFEPPNDWTLPDSWLAPWRAAGLTVPRAATRAHKARTPLARWLRSLLGFLRARVALALDTDAARVPDQLCRHEADLHVTTSELAIHLSLTALPLSIRVAGLDRDPGWIPAAGRSVRFVFS